MQSLTFINNIVIQNIYEQLERTYVRDAIELNTEILSPEESIEKINFELFGK